MRYISREFKFLLIQGCSTEKVNFALAVDMLVYEAGHVSVLVQSMVVGSAQRKLTSNGSHVGSHAGLTSLSGASAKELFAVWIDVLINQIQQYIANMLLGEAGKQTRSRSCIASDSLPCPEISVETQTQNCETIGLLF